METNPYRIGIILVGSELNSTPVKLLLVAMNRVQTHFEYEIWPRPTTDPLLKALKKRRRLDRAHVRSLAAGFADRFNDFVQSATKDYDIADQRPPAYCIVVSMAKFADNYFNLRTTGTSVIALGSWKDTMAPPSLIEFIQTLVVREAVAAICPPLAASIHFATKGCVCDFGVERQDVRLKALGMVCSYCRHELHQAGLPGLAKEIQEVLANKWVGDLRRPTSLASTLSKLGVDLFVTKGLTPTWRERVTKALQEDAMKEVIKLLFLIIGAGLLFYLGWRSEH